jgi:hypothetical protein
MRAVLLIVIVIAGCTPTLQLGPRPVDAEELRARARRGDTGAMLQLVETLEYPPGRVSTAAERLEAHDWLARAAEAGNRRAMVERAERLLAPSLVLAGPDPFAPPVSEALARLDEALSWHERAGIPTIEILERRAHLLALQHDLVGAVAALDSVIAVWSTDERVAARSAYAWLQAEEAAPAPSDRHGAWVDRRHRLSVIDLAWCLERPPGPRAPGPWTPERVRAEFPALAPRSANLATARALLCVELCREATRAERGRPDEARRLYRESVQVFWPIEAHVGLRPPALVYAVFARERLRQLGGP